MMTIEHAMKLTAALSDFVYWKIVKTYWKMCVAISRIRIAHIDRLIARNECKMQRLRAELLADDSAEAREAVKYMDEIMKRER